MMKDVLCFDMGETLMHFESKHCFYAELARLINKDERCIREYIKKFSIRYCTIDELYWDMKNVFQFQGIHVNEFYALFEYCKASFKMFADVESTLKELRRRDYKIVLLSNVFSFRCYSLEELGLKEYIAYQINSFECGYVKPEVGFFKYVEQKVNANANNLVMVGDSLRSDIRGAERAGWRSILVDYSREKSSLPYRISSLNELLYIFS